MNSRQKNNSDKTFKIKVVFDNGFALKEIQASSFGQACYRLEKELLRKFTTPTSFTWIKD